MTIRARISPNTESEAKVTIEWLHKTGISDAITWQQVYDLGLIEFQLKETPSVLAYLNQLDDEIHVSRITSEGIVFYLTDVPLRPWRSTQGISDNSDGHIFVPMSNVVCINTFGSVYPSKLLPPNLRSDRE